MRVQAICDGEDSSATSWMRGVARYSKHAIEVRQWKASDNPKPDLIYYHYGSLSNDNIEFIKLHPEIPYGMGILGKYDMLSLIDWRGGAPPHVLKARGIIALGKRYEVLLRERVKDVPIHLCDVGVETGSFSRTPPPKHFIIGYAENNRNMFDDSTLKRFLGYGFPVITAGDGKGTNFLFSKMPDFYNSISVFIDNVLDPRPGGLMYLEAGSVGRPVINMMLGTMAEWFPAEFLAEDDADVVRKLNRLKNDPEYYQYASDLWRGVAESRDYSVIHQEYDRAWEAMADTLS